MSERWTRVRGVYLKLIVEREWHGGYGRTEVRASPGTVRWWLAELAGAFTRGEIPDLRATCHSGDTQAPVKMLTRPL